MNERWASHPNVRCRQVGHLQCAEEPLPALKVLVVDVWVMPTLGIESSPNNRQDFISISLSISYMTLLSDDVTEVAYISWTILARLAQVEAYELNLRTTRTSELL